MAEDVRAWPSRRVLDTNTGIMCGRLIGVDSDILDPVLAAKVEALAEQHLGPTPLRRIGRAPKWLRCYRAEVPQRKMETPELHLADGTVAQVEVLGAGQQFVAYGIHPDTGQPYTWQGEAPDTVPLDRLPVVALDALRAFLDATTTLIVQAGGKKREAARVPPGEAEALPPRSLVRELPASEGRTFFRAVNDRALAALDRWVPAVLPKAREEANTGAWRVASADLGRGLQEDLSLHPIEGGMDWGTREPCTAIDVVMQWGGARDATEAAFWLCDRLGLDPAALGFKGKHRHKQNTRATTAPDDALRNEAAPGERPIVRIIAGELRRIVDEAEAALVGAGLGLYQRGSFIVRPCLVRVTVSDDRTVIGQRILEVGDHGIMEAMTTAAAWERYDGRSETWVATDAPMKAVKAYRDRKGRWKLPLLAGIINAPTLRPDGSILDAPGYDPGTGLLLDLRGAEFPAIPAEPTKADAEQALGKLDALVSTFPFVSEADRAVALSAILTSCVRRALPAVPMHGFTAPAAGSGKSMLVDLASVITTGREAGVIAQGKSEEELEKRLGALLLAGDAVIAVDNCETPLGGEFLCQLLTQPVVRARILGRSEAPELPSNAFVTATGNNLTLVGDMTRRALLCRLDAKHERPELRRFPSNPVAEAKRRRGELLVATLTVLRAFQVAGRSRRSDAAPPLGSFEVWSSWVRDALVWLGKADPVATMEEARKSDPKLGSIAAVVAQWGAAVGYGRTTAKGLIDCATAANADAFGRMQFRNPDFREALLVVAGEGGAINSVRLGRWLQANQDRVVGGLQITRQGLIGGTMTWQLNRSGGAYADAA